MQEENKSLGMLKNMQFGREIFYFNPSGTHTKHQGSGFEMPPQVSQGRQMLQI